MTNVSVIIPTYNRPELVKRAVLSVLNQTYGDLEVIVVDDGQETKAEMTVASIGDQRVKYISHICQKGGGAARNTGIKASSSKFIAFLDDDDEWAPDKLKTQMAVLENTPQDVGFCFCAVRNIYDDHEEISKVPDGLSDYFELALDRFKTFLTVTLVIKKEVFDKIGYFDENLPSHQETDVVIRMTKFFKGIGINKPMVDVNMKSHGSIGGNLQRRIAGRKMILEKFKEEFKKRPKLLSDNFFQLGLFYRNDGKYTEAKEFFLKSFRVRPRMVYLLHYLSMWFNGGIYKIVRK